MADELMTPYEREVFRHVDRDPPEHCVCGWRGQHSGLKRGESVEIMHPKNAHYREAMRVAVDSAAPPELIRGIHITQYEACPNCGRWLYADGQPVNTGRTNARG